MGLFCCWAEYVFCYFCAFVIFRDTVCLKKKNGQTKSRYIPFTSYSLKWVIHDSKPRHNCFSTVDAAVVYNDPKIWDTSVCFLTKSYWSLPQKTFYMYSMQCQLNDIVFDDMYKFSVQNPMVNDHSVIITSNDDIILFLHISLLLQGVLTFHDRALPVDWSVAQTNHNQPLWLLDALPWDHSTSDSPQL